MRISSTAVIAGLAVALILSSAVQASDHVDGQAPAARAVTTGGTGGAAAGDALVEFSEGGGLNFLRRTDVTVQRDGRAVVTSRYLNPSTHLDSTGTWSFTLSRSRLEQLTTAFEQAQFRSLRSRYVGECYDCGYYLITYAGRTVRCDRLSVARESAPPGFLAPKRLAPVLRLLNLLAETRQIR